MFISVFKESDPCFQNPLYDRLKRKDLEIRVRDTAKMWKGRSCLPAPNTHIRTATAEYQAHHHCPIDPVWRYRMNGGCSNVHDPCNAP